MKAKAPYFWTGMGSDVGLALNIIYYGAGLIWLSFMVLLFVSAPESAIGWWLLGIGLLIWSAPLGIFALKVWLILMWVLRWGFTLLTLFFESVDRGLRRIG